jgi:hypothetical protein
MGNCGAKVFGTGKPVTLIIGNLAGFIKYIYQIFSKSGKSSLGKELMEGGEEAISFQQNEDSFKNRCWKLIAPS